MPHFVMPGLDPGIHAVGLMTSHGCLAPSRATRQGWCLRKPVDTRVRPGHDVQRNVLCMT